MARDGSSFTVRRYGHIDILRWDGGWPAHTGTDADAWFWEPDKLSRMVRRYQPEIVIDPRLSTPPRMYRAKRVPPASII